MSSQTLISDTLELGRIAKVGKVYFLNSFSVLWLFYFLFKRKTLVIKILN